MKNHVHTPLLGHELLSVEEVTQPPHVADHQGDPVASEVKI